eukprot:2841515-Prorocentrum_lima.AAC.1
MGLTKDKELLKDLMIKLDPHSKKVMDKHYILKDPEDDAQLAGVLIESMLGKTVTFPSSEEAEAAFQASDNMKLLITRLLGKGADDTGEEETDTAEDDEEGAEE